MAQTWPIDQFLSPFYLQLTLFARLKMAPLFSKVDSNKLWSDVQNEETVICAKFGKDLLNISKVIGRKIKWPRFFWPTRYYGLLHLEVQFTE